MISVYQERRQIESTDSGWSGHTWSGNTNHGLNGTLHNIYIESENTDTTFKFKILDMFDIVVYDSEDYAEHILREDVSKLVKGIHEMQIYDVSNVEQFKILLNIKD